MRLKERSIEFVMNMSDRKFAFLWRRCSHRADVERFGIIKFNPMRLSGAKWMAGLAGLLLLGAMPVEQDAKQTPKDSGQAAASSPPSTLPPLQFDGDAALRHLNQIISWYRHSTGNVSSVGLPSDAIYADNARSLGAEVVQLAFQSAKAESALITAERKATSGSQSATESQSQNLAQAQARASGQIQQLQGQIQSVNAQLEKAKPSARAGLVSQRDALQSQLELQKALLDVIQKMAAFVENNGELSGGLEGDINRLAKSIPEVLRTPPNGAKGTSARFGRAHV